MGWPMLTLLTTACRSSVFPDIKQAILLTAMPEPSTLWHCRLVLSFVKSVAGQTAAWDLDGELFVCQCMSVGAQTNKEFTIQIPGCRLSRSDLPASSTTQLSA